MAAKEFGNAPKKYLAMCYQNVPDGRTSEKESDVENQ